MILDIMETHSKMAITAVFVMIEGITDIILSFILKLLKIVI